MRFIKHEKDLRTDLLNSTPQFGRLHKKVQICTKSCLRVIVKIKGTIFCDASQHITPFGHNELLVLLSVPEIFGVKIYPNMLFV